MTLFTVCVILITVTSMALLSVLFIRRTEQQESNQLLLLLCETGEKNLDYYFNSVQKSVSKVASFVESDLDGLGDEQLASHMQRVQKQFDEMASKTNGVLTYYYRIDPEVSKKVKGFWYTDLDGEGFVEHEVTDISQYDTKDTTKLVWFTVPKNEGNPVWLPPYVTDNLDKRVISYNVPIYWRGEFVGVVGIEIDYSTMAEQVESIRLYNNGYAYLCDEEGHLFFHPRIDVSKLSADEVPQIPQGAVDKSTFVRYTYDGVDKIAAWLPLSNGMRLNVAVPVVETEGDWPMLIGNTVLYAGIVLAVASTITMLYARRITKPLEELTEAADQVDRGNYDVDLAYDRDDEVGRLTNTFKRLAGHMKDHINDLNKRVYVDSLTSVRNKGAYSTFLDELQERMDDGDQTVAFAVGIFDCDNLKYINDRYGHEKGDVYLQTACRLICRVFQHSPVFRIGGDEFSVVLQNDDLRNRDTLAQQFSAAMSDISDSARNEWEQVHVSMGIAVYDAQHDRGVNDVLRRADELMYENKRKRKMGR
ncbi:MAG: GGDEF domain-containing protein [Coriobacteriales bacterium]|nr:GGDEF domain-containing protein [Coriobacteriales bacterium]